jgi:hypothetical protein
MKKLNVSERDAVSVLEDLRLGGYVQHVVDPHKPFKVNRTKKLYFCFLNDDKSHVNVVNKKKSKPCGSTITPKHFRELWERSDDKHIIDTKMKRAESAIKQLAELQVTTQTKLEIVHQATISLIQAVISIAVLLFVLLIYTLIVVVPTLHSGSNFWKTSAISGTVLFTIIVVVSFVIKFSRLFSVFLTLDGSVITIDDDESTSVSSSVLTVSPRNLSPTKQKEITSIKRAGKGGHSRRSSIILTEPLLRATSDMTISVPKQSTEDKKSTMTIKQRQGDELPPPSSWPHRPVLLSVNTPVDSSLQVDPAYGDGPLPIGKPFFFESDLFVGYCLVRIKDVSNSDDPESDRDYFDGRRRIFQTVVQGRFKEPLSVDSVLTGHEFVKPLQNLPHQWILKAATNIIGKIAPGANIHVIGDRPKMLAPLAGTSQAVRADEPGDEPDLASEDGIEEDLTLLGGKFANTSKPVSVARRKTYLSNPSRASKYTFDTETVYTFDFYQNILNVNTYSLELGIANISLCQTLNGQPIQCLCKTTDGRYLWSFQIWHEDLLRWTKDEIKDKKKQ